MFKRLAVGLLGGVALFGCEQSPHGSTVPIAVASAAARRVEATIATTASAGLTAPSDSATQPATPAAVTPTEPRSLCNEQAAQPFLIEAHFDAHHAAGGTAREWNRVLARAVRYRTEQYGYVEGFGDSSWSATTPAAEASVVTFFGVPVQIHRRIAPALACAETAIKARCVDYPYQPYVLSGLRKRNTYLNGEISNHVYGIALDVDPTRNPCCGCVGEWRESKRCQNEKTKFERMDMPRCWVAEFERFGFYWLGNSKIEDTMHFEFLGDPSRIAIRAKAE